MENDLKIMLEIYRAIYKKLNVDLDELIENDITKKEMWFLEYHMPNEQQEEVMDSILKTKKIPKWRKDVIKRSLWLGATPRR